MATGAVRDEWSKPARDLVGGFHRKLWHRVEICSATWQCSSDMEMKMRDCLVSGNTVVLPHGDARPFVRAVDGEAGIPHCDHHRLSISVG